MAKLKSIYKTWLAISAVGLCLVVFGYAIVQQDMRLGANEPQYRLAQDASNSLNGGSSVGEVVATLPSVDIAKSLSPFMIITSKSGRVIAASSQLAGSVPLPPFQSFSDSNNASSENWFTWQPNSDLREAAVIVPYNNGYILVARSLREVENNYQALDRLSLVAAFGVIFIPLVVFILLP